MDSPTNCFRETDLLLAEAHLSGITIISPKVYRKVWGLKNKSDNLPCFFNNEDLKQVALCRAKYSFEPIIIYLRGQSLNQQQLQVGWNEKNQKKSGGFCSNFWWTNPLMKDFFEESFLEGYYLVYNIRGVSPKIKPEKVPLGFEAAPANVAGEIFLTVGMTNRQLDLPGEYPFNWRHHAEMFEGFQSFVGPMNGNGLKIDFQEESPIIISTERLLLIKKSK